MNKLIYWLPVIIWMSIIFTLSSFEAARITQVDFLELLIKKAAHLVEYGILWWLIYRALINTFNKQKNLVTKQPKFVIYSLLFTIIYAISDETHQTLVPTRQGTIRDVFIDTAGAIIAYFIYIYFNSYRTNQKLKSWFFATSALYLYRWQKILKKYF